MYVNTRVVELFPPVIGACTIVSFVIEFPEFTIFFNLSFTFEVSESERALENETLIKILSPSLHFAGAEEVTVLIFGKALMIA